jgi:FkbM family methyltransferase
MKLITLFLRWFSITGLRLSRVSNTLAARRVRFINQLRVNLVLDVGANVGQYSEELRRAGYKGRLVSFEPLTVPFRRLQAFAGRTGNHQCIQAAVGRTDGTTDIHVSENFVSSSLLPVLDESVKECPESRAVGVETVRLCRLDSVADSFLQTGDCIHLKIDTQGTEMDVLFGAAAVLPQVASVELELSFVPLYKEQTLFAEMCSFLEKAGFRCVWLERGFTNSTSGYVLQMDGFFVRNEAPAEES